MLLCGVVLFGLGSYRVVRRVMAGLGEGRGETELLVVAVAVAVAVVVVVVVVVAVAVLLSLLHSSRWFFFLCVAC